MPNEMFLTSDPLGPTGGVVLLATGPTGGVVLHASSDDSYERSILAGYGVSETSDGFAESVKCVGRIVP